MNLPGTIAWPTQFGPVTRATISARKRRSHNINPPQAPPGLGRQQSMGNGTCMRALGCLVKESWAVRDWSLSVVRRLAVIPVFNSCAPLSSELIFKGCMFVHSHFSEKSKCPAKGDQCLVDWYFSIWITRATLRYV